MRRLPANLLDSLRAFGSNGLLREALGSSVVTAYLKLKEDEWQEHQAQISAWERQATLDC